MENYNEMITQTKNTKKWIVHGNSVMFIIGKNQGKTGYIKSQKGGFTKIQQLKTDEIELFNATGKQTVEPIDPSLSIMDRVRELSNRQKRKRQDLENLSQVSDPKVGQSYIQNIYNIPTVVKVKQVSQPLIIFEDGTTSELRDTVQIFGIKLNGSAILQLAEKRYNQFVIIKTSISGKEIMSALALYKRQNTGEYDEKAAAQFVWKLFGKQFDIGKLYKKIKNIKNIPDERYSELDIFKEKMDKLGDSYNTIDKTVAENTTSIDDLVSDIVSGDYSHLETEKYTQVASAYKVKGGNKWGFPKEIVPFRAIIQYSKEMNISPSKLTKESNGRVTFKGEPVVILQKVPTVFTIEIDGVKVNNIEKSMFIYEDAIYNDKVVELVNLIGSDQVKIKYFSTLGVQEQIVDLSNIVFTNGFIDSKEEPEMLFGSINEQNEVFDQTDEAQEVLEFDTQGNIEGEVDTDDFMGSYRDQERITIVHEPLSPDQLQMKSKIDTLIKLVSVNIDDDTLYQTVRESWEMFEYLTKDLQNTEYSEWLGISNPSLKYIYALVLVKTLSQQGLRINKVNDITSYGQLLKEVVYLRNSDQRKNIWGQYTKWSPYPTSDLQKSKDDIIQALICAQNYVYNKTGILINWETPSFIVDLQKLDKRVNTISGVQMQSKRKLPSKKNLVMYEFSVQKDYADPGNDRKYFITTTDMKAGITTGKKMLYKPQEQQLINKIKNSLKYQIKNSSNKTIKEGLTKAYRSIDILVPEIEQLKQTKPVRGTANELALKTLEKIKTKILSELEKTNTVTNLMKTDIDSSEWDLRDYETKYINTNSDFGKNKKQSLIGKESKRAKTATSKISNLRKKIIAKIQTSIKQKIENEQDPEKKQVLTIIYDNVDDLRGLTQKLLLAKDMNTNDIGVPQWKSSIDSQVVEKATALQNQITEIIRQENSTEDDNDTEPEDEEILTRNFSLKNIKSDYDLHLKKLDDRLKQMINK